MNTKVILATMAAFALAMSIVPTAAAGIPVPKSAAEAVANGGVAAAGGVTDAFADDATQAGMIAEIAVVRTAASIGDVFLEPGDGEVYVASDDAIAVGEVLVGSTAASFGVGMGYAAESSQTLAPAMEGVGFGTYQAVQTGIDASAAFGVQTQGAAERQIDLFGATTQGAAKDFGGVQAVVTQGALATYNAHAAPAACVFAGVAANLAGAVSAQQSCSLLLS